MKNLRALRASVVAFGRSAEFQFALAIITVELIGLFGFGLLAVGYTQ